jgi:3-hexulose-6-phosphate synthase
MTGTPGVRPLLQLALDAPEHLALIEPLARYFDIIEVGTPLLKRFGLSVIATVRECGAGRPVLVDTKTADGGAHEASMVGAAGASHMTVLANASPATREVALSTAAEFDVTVIYDTILDAEFDPSVLPYREGQEVWIAVHNASDARLAGQGSHDHIARVAKHRGAGYRVSLAGGIGRHNLAEVIEVAPDIIVIGSAVTGAAHPEEEAAWIAQAVG